MQIAPRSYAGTWGMSRSFWGKQEAAASNYRVSHHLPVVITFIHWFIKVGEPDCLVGSMLVFFLVFCVVFLSLICLSSSSFLLVFVIFLVCLRHLSCLSSSSFLFVFVIFLVCPRHFSCLYSSSVSFDQCFYLLPGLSILDCPSVFSNVYIVLRFCQHD